MAAGLPTFSDSASTDAPWRPATSAVSSSEPSDTTNTSACSRHRSIVAPIVAAPSFEATRMQVVGRGDESVRWVSFTWANVRTPDQRRIKPASSDDLAAVTPTTCRRTSRNVRRRGASDVEELRGGDPRPDRTGDGTDREHDQHHRDVVAVGDDERGEARVLGELVHAVRPLTVPDPQPDGREGA